LVVHKNPKSFFIAYFGAVLMSSILDIKITVWSSFTQMLL